MRKVPSWDTYFMAIAQLIAIRSKDPRTQVGTLIVNQNGHPISTGYNGMPPNYPENVKLWERENKHKFVIHSEQNALGHAEVSCKGATLYCTLSPCIDKCAKSIVASGISRVVYMDHRVDNDDSLEYLRMSGVQTQEHKAIFNTMLERFLNNFKF